MSMPFSSGKGLPFDSTNGLTSRFTQEQHPVCTWSVHAPRSGPSPSPFPLTSHTLTATATATAVCELFLFGGYVRGCLSSDPYVFSLPDFSTTLLQTSGKVPTPRASHSAALIGTTLLVCGGETSSADQHEPNHDSLYLLNLVSREWSRVAVDGPGPSVRHNHTATVVGSKLFIFGGRLGGLGGKIFNDMWTLDLNCLKSQLHWESYDPTLGNEKPLPRFGHVSVTTEDCIIIFGGYNYQHYYNDTWSFDISTRKWTELQCTGFIPSPRARHAAVLVDDVMYVFGGFTSKTPPYLDDLVALQLSTQRWFKIHNVGPSPDGRMAHAMVSDGTRVFVLGGTKGAREDEISLIHFFDTKHIKYPEPERNAANRPNPSGKITQLARKLSTGRPLELTGVNSKPRRVQEGDVSEGSTEYHGTFAASRSSSEGEVTELELERQSSVSLTTQAELDGRIARLSEELALKSALLEQAEANAAQQNERYEKKLEAKGSEMEAVHLQLTDAEKGWTSLNELIVSRAQQAGRYEMELTKVRAKLEAKESELEAVRSRLTDAEKGLTKSKADADILRAQNATGPVNRDEDQVTRRLMERVRAIEAEMVSKKWNEKCIEEMECRNEG